jgi:hypothetical protein
MEVAVDTENDPTAGEVTLFTTGGNFMVKGSPADAIKKLASEDWPVFELAESGDSVIIRSSQVVAVRGGMKARRGMIGFTQH